MGTMRITDAGIVPYSSRAAAQAASVPPWVFTISYIGPRGSVLPFVEDTETSTPALTTGDGRKWVPAGEATPYHYGAVGDYASEDTAAIDGWLAHFTATGAPLWASAGVFRYHNKRLTLPEGVIIRGVGGPRIAAYPQRSVEKDKLRPGYKDTISGSLVVFSGAPADAPITTTRGDRFASISPMVAYLHAQPYSIEGVDFVQDMDVLNAGGSLTTAATDNRASGYDCGMVSKAYAPRINVGIFGYFPKSGFVNLAAVGDGIQDPDYADISGSTITSGLAVIGAPDAGSADGGNTGCKGAGVQVYGSDHHTRADTNPAVPVLHVDGETGGSGSGIRGVTLAASSLRGYANNAIVLGACDDFSLIGCTTEFSVVAGMTGLDADGVIIGSAETGNVTLMGVAATGELGIAAMAQAISGQFTISQAGQFDGLMSGKGAGGVAGKLAAVRIAGNSVQDPFIQFTDNLASTTSGWTVRMDEDQSDSLKFARNNTEMLTITASGRLVAPNIAQTDVGMGSGTLWADPADGYRVKWKNA